MRDADAELATGCEHPRRFPDDAGHIVDVHQGVVGDDLVEAAIREGQSGGIGQLVTTVPVGFLGVAEQRW